MIESSPFLTFSNLTCTGEAPSTVDWFRVETDNSQTNLGQIEGYTVDKGIYCLHQQLTDIKFTMYYF